MTNSPAGFLVRLLADFLDFFLWGLIFSVLIFFLSDSQTLAQLFFGLVVYLVILALPQALLWFIYKPAFTHYFGGNIGKLITGLKVTNLQGHLLTFKQALFRYTIGYTFSTVLFGLGFLSIITDKQKRGFHDKAIGSKVVVTKNLWPLGLIILVILLVVHFMLWGNTFRKLTNGPLRSEFGFLMLNLSRDIKSNQPSPTPQPTISPILETI